MRKEYQSVRSKRIALGEPDRKGFLLGFSRSDDIVLMFLVIYRSFFILFSLQKCAEKPPRGSET